MNDVQFCSLCSDDINTLIGPMTRAYLYDVKSANGENSNVPECIADGSLLAELGLDKKEALAYTVCLNHKKVGAFIVVWQEAGESELSYLFVDPDLKHLGLDRKIWDFLKICYPTKSWRVATPLLALHSQYFYENCCGFVRECNTKDEVILRWVSTSMNIRRQLECV